MHCYNWATLSGWREKLKIEFSICWHIKHYKTLVKVTHIPAEAYGTHKYCWLEEVNFIYFQFWSSLSSLLENRFGHMYGADGQETSHTMNFGWVINQVKADMVEMGHPNDFIGAKVCFFFLISKKCSLFIKDVDYIHYNSIHDIRWIELVFWGLHLFKEKNFASDNWLVSSPFKLEWPFDVSSGFPMPGSCWKHSFITLGIWVMVQKQISLLVNKYLMIYF